MAGGWVQSQDVVEEGNTGVYVQEGPAANEVDRGEDYQGESIQTMHRLLTQGRYLFMSDIVPPPNRFLVYSGTP